MKLSAEFTVNIDIEGVSEKVAEAARLAMRDTVVDVHRDTLFNMEKLGIVKTGNNKRSVAGEVSGMGCVATGGEGGAENVVDSSKIEGAVYSTSGYGGYLETGTDPHVITVKNAKVLTDGETFFGKSVQHPGTNPYPTFYPAMVKNFTAEKYAERVKKHLR